MAASGVNAAADRSSAGSGLLAGLQLVGLNLTAADSDLLWTLGVGGGHVLHHLNRQVARVVLTVVALVAAAASQEDCAKKQPWRSPPKRSLNLSAEELDGSKPLHRKGLALPAPEHGPRQLGTVPGNSPASRKATRTVVWDFGFWLEGSSSAEGFTTPLSSGILSNYRLFQQMGLSKDPI